MGSLSTAEHAKLQAERALERARSDRDAAKAELESLKRVHAANIDAIKAEAEVEIRQIATAAAAEADEDWSRRLAEAVRDVRDRCIQRDRDQADEIASLRQALSDVETRYAEQLNRERSALLQARAEAEAARRSAIPVQPTSIYRDLPPPPPVQRVSDWASSRLDYRPCRPPSEPRPTACLQKCGAASTTTAGGFIGWRRGSGRR